MLRITPNLSIPESELRYTAVRSQGAGGQNVNKVASAIQLRFNIRASSLPAHCQHRLLRLRDRRITDDGVIVIKAQEHRSQEMNRSEARQRLLVLIRRALAPRKARIPTVPGPASRERRMAQKANRSRLKTLRGKASLPESE